MGIKRQRTASSWSNRVMHISGAPSGAPPKSSLFSSWCARSLARHGKWPTRVEPQKSEFWWSSIRRMWQRIWRAREYPVLRTVEPFGAPLSLASLDEKITWFI